MNEVNGSTARPRWQVEALQKHGFHDFQLVDKFNETKLKDISNTLIHAHQFSARLLDDITKAAYEEVHNYDWSHVGKLYLNLYEKLLG